MNLLLLVNFWNVETATSLYMTLLMNYRDARYYGYLNSFSKTTNLQGIASICAIRGYKDSIVSVPTG